MGKSISPILFLKSGTKLIPAPPRSHRSDEFAAGYSSAVCSPAWPASASPDGLHLPQPEVICQSVSFGRISKLDSKARTRQTINIGVGPNQSIEVGPDRNIKLIGNGQELRVAKDRGGGLERDVYVRWQRPWSHPTQTGTGSCSKLGLL